MKNATHFLTHTEAAELARRLKAKGYKATKADCREYPINIVRRLAGSDPDAVNEVSLEIVSVLDVIPEWADGTLGSTLTR